MSVDLRSERCTACHAGAPRVTEAETAELSPLIPEWTIEWVKEVPRLTRTYRLADWRTTMALVDRIGALAEAQDHHPRMVVFWGRVKVEWWTHAIAYLHRNDFVMAAKSDEAFESLK
jgi:4a-hydroxytetrahydrobiopterin dehydratase